MKTNVKYIFEFSADDITEILKEKASCYYTEYLCPEKMTVYHDEDGFYTVEYKQADIAGLPLNKQEI